MSIFRFTGRRLKTSHNREADKGTKQWAEDNVYFTGTDVSPIPGAFQTKYSPHFIKPFELIDKPSVTEMWHRWASQSGKSLFLLIPAAKRLDTEPANIIYAQPIKDDIPKIIDIKIDPVLKSIKKIWTKFEDFKSDENIRGKREIKRIAGGSMIVTGTSVKERKSLTSPMILFDECGEFEKGTIQEFRERQKSFEKFYPKTIGASTIVHPKDEICTYYDMADCKLQWQFKCRSCEEFFYPEPETLNWISKSEMAEKLEIKETDIKQYKYIKEASQSAFVQCPECGHKITTSEKDSMILNKELDWVAVEGDIDTAKSFGTDMNSLGSYFVSFGLLVEMIIKAEGDEIILDKIHRGWFNRFYESSQENKTTANDVLLLGNGLKEFVVPKDTIAIYAGVDVQSDHFWLKMTAFTYNNISNVMYAGRLEEYKQVVDLMDTTYYYEDGTVYTQGIRRLFMDVLGYVKKESYFNEDTNKMETETLIDKPLESREFIYEYSQTYGKSGEYDRIIGTRGHITLANDEPYMWTTSRLTVNNYKDSRQIKLLKTNTTALKINFMQRLHRTIEKEKANEFDAAYDFKQRLEYINQDIIDRLKGSEMLSLEAYSNQVTSEVYGYPKDKRGNPKSVKAFIQVKRHNHLLDCSAMIEAGYMLDNLQLVKKPVDGGDKDKIFAVSRGLV